MFYSIFVEQQWAANSSGAIGDYITQWCLAPYSYSVECEMIYWGESEDSLL